MDNDTSRPTATDDDKHRLTIEKVADLYSTAGHARTIRTLQRYCVSGHLDCLKAPTKLGDMYLVTPESVSRHIAELKRQIKLLPTIGKQFRVRTRSAYLSCTGQALVIRN